VNRMSPGELKGSDAVDTVLYLVLPQRCDLGGWAPRLEKLPVLR
jgi:hypothetical protein